MVVYPLPFCRLDKVGRICWVVLEGNDWLLELANGQCSKLTIKLQAVRNMLRDGFNVEVKCGCSLGDPCAVEDDVIKALCGCCKCCFLGSEGSAAETWGSTLTFISALAGRGVAIGFLTNVYYPYLQPRPLGRK